jgi:hypothetical protein
MSAPSTVAVQQFFPCVASAMTWEDWLGNFAIYYSQFNIMFTDEENWRDAANHLSSVARFGIYPLPGAEGFETWQDWANDVTTIINGPGIYKNRFVLWVNNIKDIVGWTNNDNNNVNWTN